MNNKIDNSGEVEPEDELNSPFSEWKKGLDDQDSNPLYKPDRNNAESIFGEDTEFLDDSADPESDPFYYEFNELP